MKRSWHACFDVLVLVLLANQCGACGLLDPGGSARPRKDKWGVSRDGTNKATISSWTGTLEFRTVYDQHGGEYRVAVLTDVSGLNPRDRVDRFGRVIESRPMPPVFYLTDSNHRMYSSVPVPPGTRVRVKGALYMHSSGGVVYRGNDLQREHPLRAYLSNPTTLPTYRHWATTAPSPGRCAHSDALMRLSWALWPLIFVDKIQAIDQKR